MSDSKSVYDEYREKVLEGSKTLDKIPSKVSQRVLWLKAFATHKIDNSEFEDKYKTFTFHGKNDPEAFGFTEIYVNMLMQYAYDMGKKDTENNLKTTYESRNKNLLDAVNKIKEALDDNDLLDEYDCDCC